MIHTWMGSHLIRTREDIYMFESRPIIYWSCICGRTYNLEVFIFKENVNDGKKKKKNQPSPYKRNSEIRAYFPPNLVATHVVPFSNT